MDTMSNNWNLMANCLVIIHTSLTLPVNLLSAVAPEKTCSGDAATVSQPG